MNSLALCDFGGAQYLVLNPEIPPLIYYSHVPNIIISLVLIFYILYKSTNVRASRILSSTILFFVTWVFFALIFWASNRSDIIMFAWLMDILVEPLVHIGALYLLYVLIDKKDISFYKKLLLLLIYLPIPVLLPTVLTLSGFDLSTCLATEGPIALYYTYFVEIFVTLWIIVLCVKRYFVDTGIQKRKILFLGTGTILFLLAFSWGNITGSFTDDWQLGQYGLFGMPIFIAFLMYSIVKFRALNIKLLGTQALIISILALIFSLLFIDTIGYVRAIVGITFIIVFFLGLALVKSVKRETMLSRHLEEANAQQETLIHFIAHQVKGFLTKSKYIFAELSEGTYGELNPEVKKLAEDGLKFNTDGVSTVQTILNASNIKTGKMSYDMKPLDLKDFVRKIFEKYKNSAGAKGLSYNLILNEGDNFKINGDSIQLSEAFSNLIDNSIKYTPSGSVDVSLHCKNHKNDNDRINLNNKTFQHSAECENVIFSVKDTGVGLSGDDKAKLFTEGGRGKNSQKVNVDSTGFGLYIVKNIIEAHGGKIHAESEGEGKGSEFVVELPVK